MPTVMRRRPTSHPAPAEQTLLGRAWRHRRRGEHRRAMLVLHEACCRESSSARLWTLYAVQAWRAGRRQDAEDALKQALWLRQRERAPEKTRVTRALLASLASGCVSVRLAVA